jgi:hypothetical protein
MTFVSSPEFRRYPDRMKPPSKMYLISFNDLGKIVKDRGDKLWDMFDPFEYEPERYCFTQQQLFNVGLKIDGIDTMDIGNILNKLDTLQ